jgi:hypothetical protein
VVLDESSVGQTVTQAVVVDGAQAAWALIVRNERRTGTARNARIAMIAIMTAADLDLIGPAAVPPDGGTLIGSKGFIVLLLSQSARLGDHLLLHTHLLRPCAGFVVKPITVEQHMCQMQAPCVDPLMV